MAIPLLMPALSPTMTEGNLAKWLKKEGDKVKAGDIIAEIETDKATMEVDAVDSGIIGKIVVQAGTEKVKVNQLIAVILEDGDKQDKVEEIITTYSTTEQNNQNTPTGKDSAAITQSANSNAVIPTQTATLPVQQPAQRVFASPLAKRIAGQANLDLHNVAGTGPHGRIVKRDVEQAMTHGQAHNQTAQIGRRMPEYTTLPLSNIRKVIATRLLEAKQTIPHFYLTIDCHIDELLKSRTQINKNAPLGRDNQPQYKISVNDFIIKAAASALKAIPEANRAWGGESIVQFNNIDISVAMAIEDGLITPIIHNAEQKTLQAISQEAKVLNHKAKTNSLRPEEFQGGSFTITNLGMYGVKQFNAIINPPQACILAIGAAEQKPVVVNGNITIATVLTLTLSCDHRVVDGAVAARFMEALKQRLENPVLMFI